MKNKSTFLIKSITVSLLSLFFFTKTVSAQEDSFKEFSGKVLDENTKKPLVFATLNLENSNVSTITNTEGEFLIKVPEALLNSTITISFLGYQSLNLPLTQLKETNNKLFLEEAITKLTEVNIAVPNDAEALVRETLRKKGDNYLSDPTVMTAFYRETIKKRRKNVSLSEAVVNVYKTPYTSNRRDALKLYKARKSTDYSKLDTLALKLQGGPFNALFVDMVKYPDYIFTEKSIGDYNYSFVNSTRVDDKLIYVVKFEQKPEFIDPMYKGELYIDAENKILTRAIYSLNITDKGLASKMFVRKKPRNANVWPTEVAYRVDYREKDGKWFYGYSNVLLEFKIDWDKRLFNSVYSMSCEMAVTDWEKNTINTVPKSKERITSIYSK